MTILYDALVDFAHSHSARDNGGSWAGMCGALVNTVCEEFGRGGTGPMSSARIAWDNSPHDGGIADEAPAGAFHFWDWSVDGHVGVDANAGGRAVFMTSSFLDVALGNHLGFTSVGSYLQQNRAAAYLGWSLTYTNGHLDMSRFASTIPPQRSEYPEMFIAIVKHSDWYLVIGTAAILLGKGALDRNTAELPIVEFADAWAVSKLKTVVTGIQ